MSQATTIKLPPGEIIPWPHQERTLHPKGRFIVMLGGTGGGKTFWGPYWLADLIAKDRERGVAEGAHYIAIGRTATMTSDILVPGVTEAYKGTVLEGHHHLAKAIYDLPTGGKIYFRSADKPYRIEGHHSRGIWADEPAQMRPLIWTIIQGRTGFYEAPVLFTGYPTDMGWYYHDIYKAWEGGDPDYDVIQFRSIDNPMYSRKEYDRAKRTLPGWMFDMRYDGKFRKPFGLVYPEFGGPEMMIRPFEIPDDWPTYGGVDPGTFFGATFLAWHDGIYYAYGEHYTEIVTPSRDHAAEMQKLERGMFQCYLYDPARNQDATDLADNGIGPFVMGNNAIDPGIRTVTEFVKTGRLKVMQGRCPNFVDQMEKYSYPTDPATGALAKEKPIKKYDHLPDCLRYLLHTLEGAKIEEQDDEIIIHDDVRQISRF